MKSSARLIAQGRANQCQNAASIAKPAILGPRAEYRLVRVPGNDEIKLSGHVKKQAKLTSRPLKISIAIPAW